jgi:hypothetical protein
MNFLQVNMTSFRTDISYPRKTYTYYISKKRLTCWKFLTKYLGILTKAEYIFVQEWTNRKSISGVHRPSQFNNFFFKSFLPASNRCNLAPRRWRLKTNGFRQPTSQNLNGAPRTTKKTSSGKQMHMWSMILHGRKIEGRDESIVNEAPWNCPIWPYREQEYEQENNR